MAAAAESRSAGGRTRRPLAAVVATGVPLAFAFASHALINLVDLALVGRLGADAVAGVHVATAVNFLPMILGNGVSVATMALLAQRIGAGDHLGAAALSARAQLWMLVLGVVVGVVGAVLAGPSVDLQGVGGGARAIGVHYTVVVQLGTVTMFALMQSTAAMRAAGETWMPVVLLLAANGLNLLLDVVLLFGVDALGIPAFGAVGAAYASVISRALMAIAGYAWLARPAAPLRLCWHGWRGPAGEFGRLARAAWPPSAQLAVRATAVLALTRAVAEVGGDSAVAAFSVTTRLDTLVLFAAAGIASAGTTLTGAATGAGDGRVAQRLAWASGAVAAALGLVLAVALAAGGGWLVELFVAGATPEVSAAGASYLRWAVWAHPLAAFCIGVTGAWHGAGWFVTPLALDLGGHGVVLLPAVVGAVLWAGAGGSLTLVWWALLLGHAALAALFAAVLWRWPLSARS